MARNDKDKNNQNDEPLEKKLWKTADKLRKNMDAAEYKHIVLGLIFLKYIFLSRNKQQRKGKILFIDTRNMGHLINRKNRELSDDTGALCGLAR